MNHTRRHVTAVAAALALAATPVAIAAPAFAAPDGSNVIINEVYVRGGNADGVYADYVELYNPTDQAVSLDGWSVQYFSKAGTGGVGVTALSGSIEPKGYYMVLGGSGTRTPKVELKADAQGGFNASGTDGTLILFSTPDKQTITPGNQVGAANVVDAVGFGVAQSVETAGATGSTKDDTAYTRTNFSDTDNNSVDFTVAKATPMGSTGDLLGGTTDEPGTDDPATPTEPEEPAVPEVSTVTIAEIQGNGAESPLAGQTVKTTGIVTAVYAEGGFNGIYLQTAGTGPTNDDGVSDGVFVYGSKLAQAVAKGDYIEVTGEVTEYFGLTEVSAKEFNKLEKTAEIVDPKPIVLEALPVGDAEREAYEGMLVDITGPYTVSNNYATGQWGEFGAVAGTMPVRQPSDYIPSSDQDALAAATAAAKAAVVNVDDGVSRNLLTFKSNYDWIPVPYLNVNDPLLVGAQVDFLQPMVVDYRNNAWKLQPTEPINLPDEDGVAPYVDNTDKWIDIQNNERQAAPGDFGGDVTISSFNVLNYFTDLGEAEGNCKYYQDRDGGEVTANDCSVRGAWGSDDLARQQSKIVAAINALDSSIIGLEEIENSIKFGPDRDAALNTLVAALNKAAGYDKWTAVPSPAADQLPAVDDQDVIRLAFIYQAKEVKPLGDSKVMVDNVYFDGWARQPLGQEWQALAEDGSDLGDPFAVVVNHFKSKGSLATVFPEDSDPYAGNNNQLRVAQAEEMAAWVAEQYKDMPTFVIGDLNSYSKEDPILKLEDAGYTNIAEQFGVKRHSYQFSGLVGSMDHGMANAAGLELVVGADLWNVNAMEPLAFEYSRYNYNVKFEDMFDINSPYRSSDHDPIKFALKFQVEEPAEPMMVTPDAATSNVSPNADDPASCTVKPFVTIPETEGVQYFLNGKLVAAGMHEYGYGETVKVTAEALEGYTLAEGAQAEWSFEAPSLKDLKCNVPPTPKPAPEPTKKPAEQLRNTGSTVAGVAGFAVLMLMAGAGLVAARRKSDI